MSLPFASRFALVFSVFCAVLVVSSTSGAGSDPCFDSAATQSELNGCAAADLLEADAELDRVYHRIRKAYAGDPEFLDELRAAQRAWVKLRDADLALKFPHATDDPRAHYGSAFPMCEAAERARLTRERTAFLERWLVDVEQGDVCAGSLHVRP